MTSPDSKRKFKPRPPVTAAPIAISDLTSLDLVGMTDRQLRDFLAKHPECPRANVGHRVIVRVDHFLALLDRVAANDSAPEVRQNSEESLDGILTADDVLRSIGRKSA